MGQGTYGQVFLLDFLSEINTYQLLRGVTNITNFYGACYDVTTGNTDNSSNDNSSNDSIELYTYACVKSASALAEADTEVFDKAIAVSDSGYGQQELNNIYYEVC